jgi:PIN domain nuclease of toxin-antitoxin system
VKYLLDTHALIWWLNDSPELSAAARAAVASEANEIYVSAASAWEITTKHRLGKLALADRLAANVEARVLQERFIPLPVTMAHAEAGGRLEAPHKDPFDRLLIAQAVLEDLTLVSIETVFDAYGVVRLW